jgi:carboxyl-terminal processing protease
MNGECNMENGEFKMENRAAFIKGIILGAVAMLVMAVVVVAAINVHAREVRWRGLDPNTKVMEIYDLLNRHSIMPFDKDVMLESMYRGLLDGVGDPYTVYFCHRALEAFRTSTDGAFVGIGVAVNVDPADRLVTISTAYPGAPAALAGLLPGDKIIGVNGEDVQGRSLEEVVSLIRGEEGVPVTIGIFRPLENERFDVEIVRARVEIPTVFHEMIYTGDGQRLGYVRIEGFDRVTTGQFEAALSELYADGMDGLILDVRNNPGGLLHVVRPVANHLLPPGIITYTRDINGRGDVLRSTGDYLSLPMVLLVNGRSASASELLAGAIRDHEVGTIVGTNTFGKGIVQNLFYLSDNTAIKLTVAEFFTPNGENIHGTGIAPHIEIEMSEELSRMIGRIDMSEDVQLQEAIRVVSGKIRNP